MNPKSMPQEIEEEWQWRWLDERTFRATERSDRPRYHILGQA